MPTCAERTSRRRHRRPQNSSFDAEPNEEDNLPLGSGRERVPLLRRRAGRPVGAAERHLRRPVAAVRLDAVADEGRHGHAAVLDLGLPVPRDRLLVVEAVERAARAGDVQGIPEADRRVEALGQCFQVRLGLLHPDLGRRRGRADEGRGGGEDRQCDGELHPSLPALDGFRGQRYGSRHGGILVCRAAARSPASASVVARSSEAFVGRPFVRGLG